MFLRNVVAGVVIVSMQVKDLGFEEIWYCRDVWIPSLGGKDYPIGGGRNSKVPVEVGKG